MDDIRVYNIKWQDDFKIFMPIYSSFVFEGYTNDVYPFRIETDNGDEVRYEYDFNLPAHIANTYAGEYCVVFFDHTKRPREIKRSSQGAAPKQNESSAGKRPGDFGTFQFFDDGDDNPNIKFFEKYYDEDFEKLLSNTTSNNSGSPLSRDMMRMRQAMEDYPDEANRNPSLKPFLFILKNVSRFMVRPGDPRDAEYPPLNILFQVTQLSKTDCKLVIILDKMNDLPTWFESENTNHKIKKIYIANTDADFRRKFFIDQLSGLFEVDDFKNYKDRTYLILQKHEEAVEEGEEQAEYTAKRKQFDKDGKKFSAYTEGFSVQRLLLFKAYVASKKARINSDGGRLIFGELQKLVREFEFGKMNNPWERDDLTATFKNLPQDLKKELQGQDQAIKAVVEKLQYAVHGIARIKENDRKPRAILFLVGPTGTGKTEMAKQIAKNIFGSEDSMVRFDMSEFSAEHTDSRLFGAPPGYVGYDAGGELTRAIKQNPFSLILFDEIEKANYKILDKFLQILDDGRLTDGKGETVYFTDCVIVFTSNCGVTGFPELKLANVEQPLAPEVRDLPCASLIQAAMKDGIRSEMQEKQAFKLDSGEADDKAFRVFLENTVKMGVEYFFTRKLNPPRPELLARIGSDNIVVFNFMNQATARLLTKITIGKFIEFVKREKKVELSCAQEVEEFVYSKVSDYETLDFGARGIISRVENMLQSAFSEYLCNLMGKVDGKSVALSQEGGRIVANER